jgi:hypothetical protein
MPGSNIGRGFRTAPQTGTKPGGLCGRSARIKDKVLELGRTRRANWSAIDPGGAHGGEEPAVETGVAGQNGSVAGGAIEMHDGLLAWCFIAFSPFSDLMATAPTLSTPPLASTPRRAAP